MKRFLVTIKIGISADTDTEAKDKITKLLANKTLKTGNLYLDFREAVTFSDIKAEEIEELPF